VQGYQLYCFFVCFVSLFGHGFLRREFTRRREIWHEASPISQAGLLKFRDGEIVALFRAPYGGTCVLLTHLFLLIVLSRAVHEF